MAKSIVTHEVIDGRPVLREIGAGARASQKQYKKIAKRQTGKHAGQFESSNRNTAGKRIARALWG